MENQNIDDAGSDFGDDLQYDFITPNFESRIKANSYLSAADISQHAEKQVIKFYILYLNILPCN